MATTSSTWTAKIADEIITIDTFGEFDENAGVASIEVFATGDPGLAWIEKRRGDIKIERSYRAGRPISRVTVSSLLGHVVGTDRTIKGAIEDYGSKVAQEIMGQRRRLTDSVIWPGRGR